MTNGSMGYQPKSLPPAMGNVVARVYNKLRAGTRGVSPELLFFIANLVGMKN